jgi:uncharacterized protein YhaN
MRIHSLALKPYGECSDLTIELGNGLTVVLGENEAGKSTALDALTDLLWGIPVGSRRDSKVKRKDLRIVAKVQTADDTSRLTRRADGLFAADQFRPVTPPWDRDLKGDRSWWRTRFGISHEQLREGGREVFLGRGDLAELVFAAREGASARALREDIAEQVDALFKAHRGNKKVALRRATTEYLDAERELRSVLTKADNVRSQRGEVGHLENEYERAKSLREEAARALQQAREDKRVIVHILGLRAARGHLDRITKEGDRLSPEELAELEEADEHRGEAEKSEARLAQEITDRMTEVDQLLVEEPVLAVEKDIDRLAASLEARLADLSLADDEYLPDVRRASNELRRKLVEIGVEAGADLSEAVAATRVRADYAAALNELTAQYEALTAGLEAASGARAGAESALLDYGIQIDPVTATAPDETAVSGLKGQLTDALGGLRTQKGLGKKAREEIRALEGSGPSTPVPARTTREEVDSRRHTRDEDWLRIRQVWLTGDLPEPTKRRRSADDLTAAIASADDTGDLEADERERLSRETATAEAHVEGLAKKNQELSALVTDIDSSHTKCDEMQREWDGLWQSYGVSAVPDIDRSAQVLDLLQTWHKGQFAEGEAAGKISALVTPWRSAAELAGLDPAVTVATWRARADILEQIDDSNKTREDRSRKEAETRTRWATYAAQVHERLADLDIALESEASAAQIESGILGLQERLVSSRQNRTSRDSVLLRIGELKTAVDQAARENADAKLVRTRLGQNHGTDASGELDVLAQRAREADGFAVAESQSLGHLSSAVDAGSDVENVNERLGSDDEVAVDARLAQATQNDDQVDDDAAGALERLTTARNGLKDMEGSEGAADAQATVASRQARVAHLTEQWAILALQQNLLDRTLETYGNQDSNPLLRRAGEILDRLTAGRWVALSVRENQGSRSLRVLRRDAEEVEPWQLSEGTADQVFLALRLAAMAEQHEDRLARGEPALPFILDDALIAFDDSRTSEALKILHELAEDLQVVVFTHHAHVATMADNLAGAVVSRMGPPDAVSGPQDAEELRDLVERRSQLPDAPPLAAPQRSATEVDLSAVRAWARDQGITVAERGRVAKDVVDKYLKARQ